jgi:hypothetical protein
MRTELDPTGITMDLLSRGIGIQFMMITERGEMLSRTRITVETQGDIERKTDTLDTEVITVTEKAMEMKTAMIGRDTSMMIMKDPKGVQDIDTTTRRRQRPLISVVIQVPKLKKRMMRKMKKP